MRTSLRTSLAKRLNMDPHKKDGGFTLIELLVVIVIIGILAAIAIPLFLNQREKAAEASLESDLKNAATSVETFYVDEQTYVAAPLPTPSDPNTIALTDATATEFCLDGTSEGTDQAMHYDSLTGGLGKGTCAAPEADA